MNSNRHSRRVQVVAGSESLISSAGGSLLAQTAAVSGLDRALSAQLAPWRSARAHHDPGKVVLDLALAIALGGDCLADLAVVRAQPDLFGEVASDPTVSRLIGTLAADAAAVLTALRAARAAARARVWQLRAPVPEPGPVIIDGKGVVGDDVVFVDRGVGVAPVAIDPAQVQPFDVPRDELWPKSVFTWLVLSIIFMLLSVQAVSPTRRWRIRRGARMTPRTAE